MAESRLEGMVFGRKVASSPARPRPPRYDDGEMIRVLSGGGGGLGNSCEMIEAIFLLTRNDLTRVEFFVSA